MGPIALAFGVLGLAGATGRDLSLVMFAQALPTIAFMLGGGVIGDRISRSRLMGGSDFILGAVVLVIAGLFARGEITIPRLMAIQCLVGILHALWWPAFAAIPQMIVKKEELQSANSIIGMFSNFGFFFGLSLGAAFVAQFGAAAALTIDGLTFIFAGLLVLSLKLPAIAHASTNSDENLVTVKPHLWRDLKEGFNYTSIFPWFFPIVIAFAFINMTFEATIAILGPLSQLSHGGAARWSLILASNSLGMLCGSFVALKLKLRYPMRTGMIFILTIGFWLLALSVNAPTSITLILGFLTGIAIDVFIVNWQTTLARLIDPDKMSRVMSYDTFGSFFLYPVGLAGAGPLADAITPSTTLKVAGVIAIFFTLLSLCFKSVQGLRNDEKLFSS